LARDRADDARTERAGPLAEQQPDTACGGVHQDGVARLHATGPVHQVLRRHALEHQRGRGLLADVVGQEHEVVHRKRPHRDVGSGRCARVRDPIAGTEPRRLALEDDARGFHADGRRRLDHGVESLADVDVDVVHADRRLPQPHLAPPGRRGVDPPHPEHLRPSERRRHHALGGDEIETGERASVPSEVRGQAGEAGLVHAGADELLELAFAAARHVERRLPVPERAIAVGHALELHRRDVVAHRQRGVEDAIGGDVIAVGEGEQLLTDVVPVLEAEAAHASDLIGRLAVLDRRGPDGGMPGRVAVEVAQDRPHTFDRRVDDGGPAHPDHRRPTVRRPS
jgi:hypothetical protein